MVYSRKHDMANRRKKVAKIEQVNLFTKVAAPSGLLEELNPGILNHPRNSKQVYSIIEALVRGEKLENTQSMQQSRCKKEIRDNDANERLNTLSGGNQVGGNLKCLTRPMHINSEHKGGVVCDLSVAVRKGEDHGDDKHEVMSENAESDCETVSTENTRTYWLPSGVGASSKWGPEIFVDPGERLKGLFPSSYIEELSQEPYLLLLEQCQVQALQLLACVSGCGTAYSRLVGDYDRLLDLNSCLEQRIQELEENMGQEHGPCRKYVGELEKKIEARNKQLKSLENSVSLADLEIVKAQLVEEKLKAEAAALETQRLVDHLLTRLVESEVLLDDLRGELTKETADHEATRVELKGVRQDLEKERETRASLANDVGKLKGLVSDLEEKNRVLEDNYQEEMAELQEEIDCNKEMLTAEVTYSASLRGIIVRSGEVLAATCRIGICWGAGVVEDSLVAGGLKVAIPKYKSKLCVPDLSIVAELCALEEIYKKGILPEPDSPLDMEKSPSS